MEKWIATGLVVCSLMVLAFGQHIKPADTITQTAPFTHNAGLWEADEGLNGGYSLHAGYGKREKYGAGGNFNYRKQKVKVL